MRKLHISCGHMSLCATKLIFNRHDEFCCDRVISDWGKAAVNRCIHVKHVRGSLSRKYDGSTGTLDDLPCIVSL